ncbi:MAG: hypothetical protein FDZ70_11310, partial [Actinobacteria bacterium]
MNGRKVWAAAGIAGAAVAATVWGLAVSVGAGDGVLERVELPDEARTPKGRAVPVVEAAWGGGPGQLGRSRPEEGEARGPSSLGVDDRGRVYVLDAVNRRVVRFADGEAEREWALPSEGFEDLAVSRDRFAVLDRWDDRRVLLFDADGGLVASMPVAAQVPPLMHLAIAGGEILVEAEASIISAGTEL